MTENDLPNDTNTGIGGNIGADTVDGSSSAAAAEFVPDERGFFPGDSGTLAYDARRAYVQLMRKTYISAETDPEHWRAVQEHEAALRSRMSDLFLELRVDRRREIAMKWQVPAENGDIASLLRPLQYTRELAAVMFIAREALLDARTGSSVDGQMREEAWLDVGDIIDLVLTYPSITDNRHDQASSRARAAVEQARKMNVLIGRPDATRLRVSPVVELLLPIEKLVELSAWFGGDQEDVPEADHHRTEDDRAEQDRTEEDAR